MVVGGVLIIVEGLLQGPGVARSDIRIEYSRG